MRPALLFVFAACAAGCPAPAEYPYPVRDCSITVRFVPPASLPGDGVLIRGEWNGFSGDPMVRQQDGAFVFTATLEPRDYAYALEVGGGRVLDEANPYRRWVGNEEYSLLRVVDCSVPELRLESFTQPALGEVRLVAQYVDGNRRATPEAGWSTVTLDGQVRGDLFPDAHGRFELHLEGLPEGKHTLTIAAQDGEGRSARPLYLPFWVEAERFDWQEAILYFAFTDRFANGDPSNDAPVPDVDPQANYEGGDWAGITQKIDEGYFDDLGVRAIWISPVQANPDGAFPGTGGHLYTGYHGYWPSKAREPQRRFGTLEDLRALTRAAHAHGIRVITDLVINHVHEEHEYFAAHRLDGWFNTGNSCVCGESQCDWEARRLDCWFTPYLPDLNWRNAQASEQLAEDALWWIEAADLDGFRLDAVKHVDHVAGRTIAGRLHEISQRTGIAWYLVGETFTGTDGRAQIAQYLGPNELDGQFDFPLYWSIIDAFAKGGPLTAIADALEANDAAYPPVTLNSPFIGNHDVPRFISIAANQIDGDAGAQAWSANRPPGSVTDDGAFARARDALTFALTLPGVPLLYYGDEIGLPGAGDPDNRRMMRFGAALSAPEAQLLEHVKKVGQARRHNRGLRFGARYTLVAEADTLILERDDAASDDGAVVTIHRGGEQARTVALRGRLKGADGLVLTDVVSGRSATIHEGMLTLPLPAQSAGLWIPQ
ncbi:MAG: glycosyl hydrolase [Myxococcaceae bacterium]|nr:glycosyl hydrolase [Myxococcaceae bacterium]